MSDLVTISVDQTPYSDRVQINIDVQSTTDMLFSNIKVRKVSDDSILYDSGNLNSSRWKPSLSINKNGEYYVAVTMKDGTPYEHYFTVSGIEVLPSKPNLEMAPDQGSAYYPYIAGEQIYVQSTYDDTGTSGIEGNMIRISANNKTTDWGFIDGRDGVLSLEGFLSGNIFLDDGTYTLEAKTRLNSGLIGYSNTITFRYYDSAYKNTEYYIKQAESLAENADESDISTIKARLNSALTELNKVPNYNLSEPFMALKDRITQLTNLVNANFKEPDITLPVALKLNTVFVIDKSTNMSTDGRMVLLNLGMAKMIQRLQDMQKNYKITITTRFIFFGPSSIQSSSQVNISNVGWTNLNADGTTYLAPAVSDMMTKVLDAAHFPTQQGDGNLTPLFILYSSGHISDEEQYNQLIHQFDGTYWGMNSKRIAIGVTKNYQPVLDTWEHGSNDVPFNPENPDDGLGDIIPPIVDPHIPQTNALVGSLATEGLDDSLVENTEDFFIRANGFKGGFNSYDKLKYKIEFGSRAAGKTIQVRRKDGYLMSVTLNSNGSAIFNAMNSNDYFLYEDYPEITSYDGIYNQVITDFDKGKYYCKLTLMRYNDSYKAFMLTNITSMKYFKVYGPPTPSYISPINYEDFIRIPVTQSFSVNIADPTGADDYVDVKLYIDGVLVKTNTTTYNSNYSGSYNSLSSFNVDLRGYALGSHTWYCVVSNKNYSITMDTRTFTISLANPVLTVSGRDRYQTANYSDITALDSNIVCTGIYDFNLELTYATYFYLDINGEVQVNETQDFSNSAQDSKYLKRTWSKVFDTPGTYNITLKYNKGGTQYTKTYKIIINDYPVSLNSTVSVLDRYNIPSLDIGYAPYNIVSLNDIKAVTTATMKSGEVKPFTYFATGELDVNTSYLEELDNDRYHAIRVGSPLVTLKLVQGNRTISTSVTIRINRYAVSLHTGLSTFAINKYVWTSLSVYIKYSDNSTSYLDYTKLSVSQPTFIESNNSNGLVFRSLKDLDGIIGLTYPDNDSLVKFPELFENQLNMNFTTTDSEMAVYTNSINVFDNTGTANTYTAGEQAVLSIGCDGDHKLTITCKYADYFKITKNGVTVKERTFNVATDSYSEYVGSSYNDTVTELGSYVYHIEMTKNTGVTLSYDINLSIIDYIVSMQQGQIYNVNWRTGEVSNAGNNVNSSLPNEIFYVDNASVPSVPASNFGNLIIQMKSGAVYNYDQYMNAVGTHFNYTYSDSAIKFVNSIVGFTSYDIVPGYSLYKTLTITYNRPYKNLHYTAAFIFTPEVIFSMTGRKKFDEGSLTEITASSIAYRGIYVFKVQWNYAKMSKVTVNNEVVYDVTQDFSDTSDDALFTQSYWTKEFDVPGTYDIVVDYISKNGTVSQRKFTITITDYPVAIESNLNKPIIRYPIPQSQTGYEEYNTVSFEGYITVTMKSGLVVDFNEISGFGTATQSVNSSYLYKLPSGNYACIRHGTTYVTYTISKPYYTLQTSLAVNINRYATQLQMYSADEIYIDKYEWSRAMVKIVWSDGYVSVVNDNTVLSIRKDDHIRYRLASADNMQVTAILALPGMIEFTYPTNSAPYFDGLFSNKAEVFIFVSDTDSKLTVTGLKTFDNLAYEDIPEAITEISYDGTYKLKIKVEYADSILIKRDGVIVYQYDYNLDTDPRSNYLVREVEYTLDQLGSTQFEINIVRNTGLAEYPDIIHKDLKINITDYATSLHDGYIGTFESMKIDGITYPAITKTIDEYFTTTVVDAVDVTELKRLVIRMKSGKIYDYLGYMSNIGTHLTESHTAEMMFYNNKFATFNKVPTVNYAEFNYLRPYYKLSCYRVAFLGTAAGTYVLKLFQSNKFEIDRITFIWDANLDEVQNPDVMRTAYIHLSNEILNETLDVEFSNGKHLADTLIPGNRFDATISLKYVWSKSDGTKEEIIIESDIIQPVTKPIDFGHNVITITPYEDDNGPTFLFLVDWTYPTQVINKDISFYNVSIYDKIPVEVVWDYTDKPTTPVETPDDDISDNATLKPIGVKQYAVGDKDYSVDDSSYLLNPFDPASVWDYRWITVKSLIEYGTDYVVVEQ